MAFFSPERLQPRKIEIDQTAVNCQSPEVAKRLERIESNYAQLDKILADLESKMDSDERLQAIADATPEDFEQTFGIKQKRKWKPATRKKSKRPRTRSKDASISASADPRKPR